MFNEELVQMGWAILFGMVQVAECALLSISIRRDVVTLMGRGISNTEFRILNGDYFGVRYSIFGVQYFLLQSREAFFERFHFRFRIGFFLALNRYYFRLGIRDKLFVGKFLVHGSDKSFLIFQFL